MKVKQKITTIKIVEVCNECGITANVLTCLKKYKSSPKKLSFNVSTYHKGKCDVCGDFKHVTEARDFFYPDFSLIQSVINFLNKDE